MTEKGLIPKKMPEIPKKMNKRRFNHLIDNKVVTEKDVAHFVKAFNNGDPSGFVIHGGNLILLICEDLCRGFGIDPKKHRGDIGILKRKEIVDRTEEHYLLGFLLEREAALEKEEINADHYWINFHIFLLFVKKVTDKIKAEPIKTYLVK